MSAEKNPGEPGFDPLWRLIKLVDEAPTAKELKRQLTQLDLQVVEALQELFRLIAVDSRTAARLGRELAFLDPHQFLAVRDLARRISDATAKGLTTELGNVAEEQLSTQRRLATAIRVARSIAWLDEQKVAQFPLQTARSKPATPSERFLIRIVPIPNNKLGRWNTEKLRRLSDLIQQERLPQEVLLLPREMPLWGDSKNQGGLRSIFSLRRRAENSRWTLKVETKSGADCPFDSRQYLEVSRKIFSIMETVHYPHGLASQTDIRKKRDLLATVDRVPCIRNLVRKRAR